jgi:hypothetical protein
MHRQANKKTLVFLGLAFSMVSACIISYQFFTYKCLWLNCAPARDFTVYELELPVDLFPKGAEIYPLKQDRGVIAAVEEAIGGGRWEDGGGYVYITYKFATRSRAENWFDADKKDHLFTMPLDNPEQFNEIVTYQSPIADEYDVACGYILELTSCITRARYQEFYILFNGYVTNSGMTQQDYLSILMYIDQRMLELLD